MMLVTKAILIFGVATNAQKVCVYVCVFVSMCFVSVFCVCLLIATVLKYLDMCSFDKIHPCIYTHIQYTTCITCM